jgi:YVTN family beta-propeller protein
MKSQPELEERLRAAADRLEVGAPPIERIVRRGHRRFSAKVASSAVVAAVIVAALAWTGLKLSGFRQELRLGDGTTIPKPHIVQAIPLSGPPWGVAFDGRSVWVTSYFDDLVSQVDPGTNRELRAIRALGTPYELAAGRDAIWVAGYKTIRRVDIQTGKVTDVTSLTAFSQRSNAAAIGEAFGSVWIIDVKATPLTQVIRFDPETSTAAKIPVKDATALEFDAGSVWVSTCQKSGGEAGVLYRIDPTTNQVATKIQLPGALCLNALTAEDGFVYTTTSSGGGHVRDLWKIDASTNEIVAGPVRLGPKVGDMVSFRAVLWMLDQGSTEGETTFLRLVDSTTLRTLFRIRVGQNAHRIAVGLGSLWIPAMKDGKPVLFRVRP